MASRTRLLPAFAALLAPLLLLAWLGQSELQRLGERAEKALTEQALLFLKAASLRLGEQMQDHASRCFTEALTQTAPLPRIARSLGDAHPEVADLFVLDANGQLVFPRSAQPQATMLPFHTAATAPLLNAAELLELAGDFPGAAEQYETFLAKSGLPTDQKLRAQFSCAGVMRKLGKLDQAIELYQDARVLAELPNRDPLAANESPAIALLCRVALAELAGSRQALVDLMNAIADGKHSPIADELLQALFQRLGSDLAALPTTDSSDETVAREAEVVRAASRTLQEFLAGRRFAREYRDLLQETMRRRLANPPTQGLVFLQHSQGLETSLLVLRETRPEERQNLQARLRDLSAPSATPRWIGLRLSAGFALNAWMDPFLTPDAQGFSLAILDENGAPVLPLPASASEAGDVLGIPDAPALADLRLRAVPVDPGAFVRAEQAATRNRKFLSLGLVALAVGGAFFLARSAARDAEQAAERMGFVSRVSHELKTPLALIKMYAETLLLGRASGDRDPQRCASIISREADRLTTMIERVLDFSRSEAGTLSYTKERIDVSDLLLSVTDEFRPRAEERGGGIEVAFEDQLWVDADPEALHGAVVNLLDNAVKYTPATADDRTIEIDLRGAADRVVLEVRDRGIGIPEGERERVFSGFFRASNSGEVRGFGLGLSLVKHFVDHHSGTIEALGREGGGTILRMTLPRVATPAADPSPLPVPAIAQRTNDEERS